MPTSMSFKALEYRGMTVLSFSFYFSDHLYRIYKAICLQTGNLRKWAFTSFFWGQEKKMISTASETEAWLFIKTAIKAVPVILQHFLV